MFLNAIHQRAARDPNGIAVITEDRRITNAVLWDEMTSLTAWLLRQGLVRGDRVGISIKNEYAHLLTSLAAMLAGLPQITLPHFDPIEARRSVAERINAAVVLADHTDGEVTGLSSLFPDFDYRATAGDPGWDFARNAEDDVCLYLVSSGTTGRAKIIPLGEAQLLHQAMTAQRTPDRAVVYRPASIEFNNSKRHRLYCAGFGGVNVLLRSVAPSDVSEICRRYGVTQLGVSVAQTKRLLDLRAADARLPDHTELHVRGSLVTGETRRAIQGHITTQLVVGYGASEFGSIATAGPEDHARNLASVGRPNRGVELQIVDGDDRPVSPGIAGRIRARSAGMSTGYHGDDAATAKSFRDGWFYPEDVGHFGEEGDLRFDGRTDEMIMLSSINIFPAEIESVAEKLPGVVDCAAFSIKSDEFGEIPLVAIVSDGSTTPGEVLVGTRKALGISAPRRVFFVEAIPRNAEGKILRNELRRLLEERSPSRAVA